MKLVNINKMDWKDIKIFLFEELSKTNTIMTLGTIGSCEIKQDIDIIITKKPSAKSFRFYQEIDFLFSNLNKFIIKKYKKKLIQFTQFTHQEDVLKQGKYKEGDLAIHLMAYPSMRKFYTSWISHFNTPYKLKEFLIKEYSSLYGNMEDIFKKDFEAPLKRENISSLIFSASRFNSNYPKKEIILITKKLIYYAQKHCNQKLYFKIKTVKDAKKAFFKIIEILEN